ncbi:tRNA (uracil-O(2)-)-methyltransferase [[Candida] jaroonii]|uniref:tRNA (Uracil-O(2)-)-methyltransferase n=1 Tax=[Candida] jaroonii TaxID=467808 RepID=A0ACA9Y5D5_9ASCO|nr:tRNA (uracil-O(2)-)-methyltransferase [[Candida] jaroonii]
MKKSKNQFNTNLIIKEDSILGSPWVPIFENEVEFEKHHYESAMSNIIKEPNINSTVIMRADILIENSYGPQGDRKFTSKHIDTLPEFPESEEPVLCRYHQDAKLRDIPLDNSKLSFKPKCEIVRRIIPRNPFKDYIINQTSVILTSGESILVVYIPHIKTEDEIPFYLPSVLGIGILYHEKKLSIHYLPFNYENNQSILNLKSMDPNDRDIRIAQRLIQTSTKHSQGTKDGYEKRVYHDLIISKESFQNRYISLKKKYSSNLVNEWKEKTDPKKHVFEDLAIAAFLIEFWHSRYPKKDFEFLDVGCGNGLLVYILHMEGFTGKGIDARKRKSWDQYPQQTKDNLFEKIIIPSILLQDKDKYFQIPDANDKNLMTFHSSEKLSTADHVFTTDLPSNTFIIGNHSDELTCWIPLLGFPFMVIPCCSHALSGIKKRYSHSTSTYAALVDHVEELTKSMGWIVEKEYLRIPSTRNVAIIGFNKHSKFKDDTPEQFNNKVKDILQREGGGDAWVENSLNLMKSSPRDH